MSNGNEQPGRSAADDQLPHAEVASSAVDAAFSGDDNWRAEVQAAEDRALRAQAELENYRKRIRREMEEDRKYAALPLVRDLLSVVDNLERAIAAAENSTSAAGLLEGVKMVAVQFEYVLKQHQCAKIATVGVPFDPNLHQAIAQEASTEHAAGIVTRTAQVGYSLHDRVVRPAQVFVSTGAPATANPPPA
jgi:molecular chaperone GrpE